MMTLIGRYRSPFTRRVAIALKLLGYPYEHRPLTAWTNLADVRQANPVGRVPALVLDSGETLFDSAAILDYLDQQAGPEKALVPPAEPRRHQVLRVVACAMGALEKVVAVVYEQNMRPTERVHAPWVDHNEGQARSALQWLEDHADSYPLADSRLNLAHVSCVAMLDFTHIVNPDLVAAGTYPRLAALVEECDKLPAFALTMPVNPVDQASPSLPPAR